MTRPTTPPARVQWRLGSVRGVPIVVGPSWLLIAALLTAVYGPILRDGVDNLGSGTAYLCAFAFAVLFAFCILAHELGHTLVCLRLGYTVREIVLYALGGVSEIEGEPRRARDELLISIAGPLVSVAVTVAAWFGADALTDRSLGAGVLYLLAGSNAVLAAFNLLPGLPLDGGRVLRAIIWGCGGTALTSTRVAAWAGRILALVVAVAGLIANRSSVGIAAGVFGVALAVYLWFGATQALKVAELRSRLPGVAVVDLLRPGLLVPADLSVAEALRRAWDGQARGLVVLDATDRPSAIVDEMQINALAPDRRAWTSVSDVARPLEPGLVIPLGVDAEGLLERMQATPAHEYLVVDGAGRPAGIIATVDFAKRLREVTR